MRKKASRPCWRHFLDHIIPSGKIHPEYRQIKYKQVAQIERETEGNLAFCLLAITLADKSICPVAAQWHSFTDARITLFIPPVRLFRNPPVSEWDG